MNSDIRKILEAAIQAPSGENTQPWRFCIKGFSIQVHNLPGRDQSVYNWAQTGSYIANGAVIENMVIAAKEYGYNPSVNLFPDILDPNLVAQIKLTPMHMAKDPLFSAIFLRATNRKAYKIDELPDQVLQRLKQAGQSVGVMAYFTQKAVNKKILGRVGSANEEIMLSNKNLHHFFFNHVNWSKAEDDQKKIGFFIDTLEFAPPARASFKLLKRWGVMNILKKLNFQKIVARQNAAINASAAGFGALSIAEMSPSKFVEVGRTMERIWLTATNEGLSFQPVTGVLFFHHRVNDGKVDIFSPAHVGIIKKVYNDVKVVFGIPDAETPVFMFRFGKSEKPSARSVRFSVDEVTEIVN